jgi:hypothetical protein
MSPSLEDFEDITPQVIPRLIVRAEAGDFRAARRLLELFSLLPLQDRPPELDAYVQKCAARVADGVPTDEAFNLKQPRGRPATDRKLERDVLIAVRVDELREHKSYENAVNTTAQEFHVSESAVKRAYEAHGDPLRSNEAFERFKHNILRK